MAEVKSLYEYLGKPAGPDLGRAVYQFAKDKKAKIESKEITNPKFNGKVLLYETTLLDEYFGK